MNNSKDLWSISSKSTEMSLAVPELPLKELAGAPRGSAALLRLLVVLPPRQWDQTAALSTRPYNTIIGQPLTILINTLELNHDPKTHLPGGRAVCEIEFTIFRVDAKKKSN